MSDHAQRRLTVVCSSCLPGRPCFACAPDDNSPDSRVIPSEVTP